MSFVRIWLHCVWGTKNRYPFLAASAKNMIIEHIKQNARRKNIYIDCINGHSEHLHCLISLHPEQSLSNVIQLIKGEASFWINKSAMFNKKFEWADEYFAVSLSDSRLQKVRDYINNQEEHHKQKTWQQEYEEFITKFGFNKVQG